MRWKDRGSQSGWRQQQLAFHEEQHHVVTHGQLLQLGFLLCSEDSKLQRNFKVMLWSPEQTESHYRHFAELTLLGTVESFVSPALIFQCRAEAERAAEPA